MYFVHAYHAIIFVVSNVCFVELKRRGSKWHEIMNSHTTQTVLSIHHYPHYTGFYS